MNGASNGSSASWDDRPMERSFNMQTSMDHDGRHSLPLARYGILAIALAAMLGSISSAEETTPESWRIIRAAGFTKCGSFLVFVCKAPAGIPSDDLTWSPIELTLGQSENEI